ncbi:BTB/POZ domain and ankyrin repeat-containing protein [Vigna angularis]|uniref:BTB/POZ domain and ankyrin repeat-containing protein n=1 Tax=Phaseolus angularis TaxID=3914 RepID=A0A8T0KI03_PHAAN|nr:BTB/POZ domain and ankyrin repeat-containing protein [Vigna angularis]
MNWVGMITIDYLSSDLVYQLHAPGTSEVGSRIRTDVSKSSGVCCSGGANSGASEVTPLRLLSEHLGALDSDDVELVRLLLKEGHTTLDDAYALHYAVAYCDVKTTSELLDLGLADVNHKNHRGYSISKRLTKALDYYNATEEGKVSCNDRLCIEILEQAQRHHFLLLWQGMICA